MEDPKGIVDDLSKGANTGIGILEEFAVIVIGGAFLAGVLTMLAIGHFCFHWR